MEHRYEHPDFAVSVQGEFAGNGHWLIHGVIRYAELLGAASIERIAPEARFELMHRILQEDRRGRGLGATSVHVLVEGDGETARFFEILGRRASSGSQDVSPSPRTP